MKTKTIKSCTTYQVNLKTGKEQIYSRQHFRTNSELELAEFYNESGKCFLKNKYTFDKRGNNIEDLLFENDIRIKKWIHFHNEQNQHIETHFHDEDGLTGYYEYRFNEKGECIEELEYDNIKCLEMRTVYQYNAQSRMIEEACFDADNHLFEKTTTSYNAKNRIAQYKITHYNIDNDIDSYNVFTCYYKNGDQLEKQELLSYSRQDQPSKEIELYNEHEDTTSIIEYDEQGKLTKELKYEYEYDLHQNCTKKSIFRSGKLTEILTIRYVYY